ncbi:hypothetical protein M0804_004203 [Polistes exclamans]|nr:hypothetical protein M0804_004203 [Polistes exclamans]
MGNIWHREARQSYALTTEMISCRSRDTNEDDDDKNNSGSTTNNNNNNNNNCSSSSNNNNEDNDNDNTTIATTTTRSAFVVGRTDERRRSLSVLIGPSSTKNLLAREWSRNERAVYCIVRSFANVQHDNRTIPMWIDCYSVFEIQKFAMAFLCEKSINPALIKAIPEARLHTFVKDDEASKMHTEIVRSVFGR